MENKVGIVTGAGRGIGRAVALLMGERGVYVVPTARTESEILAVADIIINAGGSALPVAGDITQQDFVEELFSVVEKEFEHLDFLVNNAGIAPFGQVQELDPGLFQECLEVNVVAPFRCMQQGIRIMKKNSTAGKIINIGSVRSHWTESGDAGAYNASKFALRGLTESVARQLHGDGSNIAVGMVCPGVVDTTLTNPEGKPRPNWLESQQVAEAVLHALSAPAGVNYYDTTLFPTNQSPW